MPSARDWHGGQLAVAWLAVPALLAVVRRALEAGVYQAMIEGHRVTIVSGLWMRSFAAAVGALATIAAVATLGWLTYTWVAGSRDRERMATMTESPHRRPLM